MVIEDKAGSTIVSGGMSNVLTTSVLESLYEEDDDSSSTTDGTADQGGGLDSGCGSTKAESSDVSSLSGGFAGKNENNTGSSNMTELFLNHLLMRCSD